MEILLNRLSCLSHPHRMAIFRLLVRRYPDAVPAGDISAALGLKSSTTSVYLGALTRCGLIQGHRTGTSIRYVLDLASAKSVVDGLMHDCCRGRPDLCDVPYSAPTPAEAGLGISAKYNVLFICTGNSARSIFAEAILRSVAGDRFEAFSAGTQPYSDLNAVALDMLRQKNHDISVLRAKNISEFQGPDAPRMDFVFTVCDGAANEDCPTWPGQPVTSHWGLPGPVKATGTVAEKALAFQRAYGELHTRIGTFVTLRHESLDRLAMQTAVDTLGRKSEIA